LYKYGLKLWSTNKNYIEEAVKLFEGGIFDYIELFSVPGSFEDHINLWKSLNIPFIIHAAHFGCGMNLADKDNYSRNMILASEAVKFADELKSDIIIFHSGVNGNIDETIRQLKKINDRRVVIENKPFYGLKNEKCVGYSPSEIIKIQNETEYGFCLDIGHAICAANAQKKDRILYLKEFIGLKPDMYHLTDGEYDGIYDMHKHFSEGNYPVGVIFELIPDGSMITNEAKKNSVVNLNDFIIDINYLVGLGKNGN
jgi:deoxyribonuclease IV